MGVSTSDIIFSLQDVGKRHGARILFEGVTLSFLKGARIGVIGPNGMGKSSLLRIMAGEDKDYEGTLIPAPGTKVGYVPQEPKLDNDLTVIENVETAVAPIRALVREYEAVSARLGEDVGEQEMEKLLEKMTRLQEEIEARDAWELDRHIEQAMQALGLPPADSKVGHLSGGEKRRVALCRALMEHPDLLLLDEPTNHLDADTVTWLEKHLQDYKGTLIVVTHDRYFLDNVVGWMLEIDRGQFRPYEGNYSDYLKAREEFYRQRQKEDDERGKAIARELEWIRTNPKGRTTKSKARISRYEELVAQARKAVTDELHLHIPFTRRLGDQVLSVEGVGKGFDGRELFRDLSFELPPGAILGVVGPNGAGKTTLVRMIVGLEKPDQGRVKVGPTVDLCYLDQSREALKDDRTVYDEITGGTDVLRVGDVEMNGRAYVSRFNFRGQDQSKKMGTLSGGERNRVLMAKMLARGGNCILLDEPTNDLDLPTLRELEEALLEFPGVVICVTHDRFFMDRIATHILAFTGEDRALGEGVAIEGSGDASGRVFFHPGNYQSWREYYAALREKAGLPPIEAVGAHRKFRGS
jgi:ATP-binding cassette ChvD family protein